MRGINISGEILYYFLQAGMHDFWSLSPFTSLSKGGEGDKEGLRSDIKAH